MSAFSSSSPVSCLLAANARGHWVDFGVVQFLSDRACRRKPKLNSVNTCVIVKLLRFLISDLCSPGTFPWSTQRSRDFDEVEQCVSFVVLNCCSNSSQCLVWHHTRHVLKIDRSFSNHTLVVLAPNDSCRHSVLPNLIKRYALSSDFNIPDSSGTEGRCQVYADDGMYQRGRTPVFHSYSVTTLFAQKLLPSTVVTVVVTGSTLCFFTVSLSLSLVVPVLGRDPLFTCRLFCVKAWPRRHLAHSLCPKQPSRLHDTPPTWRHARARASSPCSQQSRAGLVLSQANGLNKLLSPRGVQFWRMDRELLLLRRRHHAFASLVQVSPDIQPHRSVCTSSAPKRPRCCLGRWACSWHSRRFHGTPWPLLGGNCCSFLERRRAALVPQSCVQWGDCAGWWFTLQRPTLFLLLCTLSLTATVCDEACGWPSNLTNDDPAHVNPHQVACNHPLFVLLEECKHKYSQRLWQVAHSQRGRKIFVREVATTIQRVHSLICVTDDLRLGFFTFVSRTVLSRRIVARISSTLLRRTSTSRHNDDTMSQTVLIGASRSSFASFHSFRNGTLCGFCVCLSLWWEPGVASPLAMSTIVSMYYIRGASTVLCTFCLIGTCCIHNLIRNCTCENSTVFFLDRLSSLDCCCQRRRSDHLFHGSSDVSEVGSHPRLPRPHTMEREFLHHGNRRSGQ